MSLQESARRLYKAQYGDAQGSAKTKLITQGLDTVSKSIDAAVKNIKEKQEQFSKDWYKKQTTLLEAVKDDPAAREAFTNMLDKEKKVQDKANRMSTRFLLGKEKKKEAARMKAESDARIKASLEDFKIGNSILAEQKNKDGSSRVFSKANTISATADSAYSHSPKFRQDLEYSDEGGIYTTLPSTGKRIRVKEYPVGIYRFDEGIERSGSLLSDVSNTKKYTSESLGAAKQDLTVMANNLISNKDFKSLVFDDIGEFNYADENFKSDELYKSMDTKAQTEYIEGIKVKYDEDKEFREKVQQDWKVDYINAGIEGFNEVHFPEEDGDEVSKEEKGKKDKDTIYSSITRTYIPKKDIKNVKDRVAAGESVTALDGSGIYEPVYEGKPPLKKQLVGYKRFKDKSGDPIEDDKLLKIGSNELSRKLYAEEPTLP